MVHSNIKSTFCGNGRDIDMISEIYNKNTVQKTIKLKYNLCTIRVAALGAIYNFAMMLQVKQQILIILI